jgi:hypothetical protein
VFIFQPGGAPPDTRASSPQIRRSIASLFPNRDCFTLVRPVNDEKQLQQLDGTPRLQLANAFLSLLTRFIRDYITDTHALLAPQRCRAPRFAPSLPPAWTP